MKQFVLVGVLTGALAGLGYAQAAAQQAPPTTGQKQTAPAGKKAPRAPRATQAGGETTAGAVLATITIPANVKANDQPLAKGTYQVRLSSEEVKPAPGTDPNAEKWVEFVQRGQVKGKEVASVVPNSEVSKIAEDKQAPPPAGKAKVQLLKQKNYYRVWISKGGNSYLVHLPPA